MLTGVEHLAGGPCRLLLLLLLLPDGLLVVGGAHKGQHRLHGLALEGAGALGQRLQRRVRGLQGGGGRQAQRARAALGLGRLRRREQPCQLWQR